jgi:hypothetical protein
MYFANCKLAAVSVGCLAQLNKSMCILAKTSFLFGSGQRNFFE